MLHNAVRLNGSPAAAGAVEVEDGEIISVHVHVVQRQVHMADPSLETSSQEELAQPRSEGDGLFPASRPAQLLLDSPQLLVDQRVSVVLLTWQRRTEAVGGRVDVSGGGTEEPVDS